LGLGGQFGTQLVDKLGKAVQLRGMSVFNPGDYDDCITSDSVKFLVSNWGISILRIPMSGDPGVYNQRAQYVDYARDAGIYAIVDFHYTGSTPIVDDNARNFWREMATRFKDYDNVFYETFNEPGPDADWNADIKPFHEAMLNIIRPIDPHAIVLCGTRRWSQMVWQVPGNEVQPSKNVMYVRHSYAATHKDYDEVSAVLDKIPIFMSEWGVCDASGSGNIDGGSAQTWVGMMAAKSHNPHGVTISWANWGYDDKGESCAALQPGACPAHDWDRTSQSGSMVKGYLKESLEAVLGGFTRFVV
jgi:endoglucanase